MNPKRAILVTSGKGGTGKSTVAVNLAVELSRRVHVGLIDADVRGPDVIRMLGLRDKGLAFNPERQLIPVYWGENLEVFSTASIFPEDTGIAWKGEAVRNFLGQSIRDVAWGPIQYLVCDMEPSAGDSIRVIAEEFPGKVSAVLVSTPRYVSLDDARRMLDLCIDLGVDVVGVIANMVGSECPVCGEPVHHCAVPFEPFGPDLVVREFASLKRIPYLGAIRFNPRVGVLADKGVPSLPSSANGIILDLAKHVEALT